MSSKRLSEHSRGLHRFLAIPLWVMVLVCLSSCTATGNKNCTTSTDVFLKAVFYSASLDAECGLTVGQVFGLGNDSIWMENTQCSSLSLPLHPNEAMTAFSVSFMMTDSSFVADTLYFHHTNHPYALAMECGGIVMHEIESVSCTTHCLDSLTLVDAHVDNVLTTNVKIWVP